MPSLELNFMPKDGSSPTDEQLLLQLVYGLCGSFPNAREERCDGFISSVGIPNPEIRRLAKLLVSRLELPISPERVDDWIKWRQSNQCWIVSESMGQEVKRLTTLTKRIES